MATKSIFKTVEIRDDKAAKAFLDAIESSRRAQKNIKEPKVSAKQLKKVVARKSAAPKKEEIKDFIGKVVK